MRLSVVVVFLSCFAGCRTPTSEPTPGGVDASSTPAPTQAPEPSDDAVGLARNPTYEAYDGPLAAASERGVFLLDARGAIEVVLSDKPGRHPRWLRPGESLLVLRSGKQGLSLVEIDVAKRSERVVAGDLVGDSVECPAGIVQPPDPLYDPLYDPVFDPESDELDVQDDRHFVANAELGLACAILMDSNFNMHNVLVEAKVGLTDGTVTRRVHDAAHCEPPPPTVSDDDPECLKLKFTVENHRFRDSELESIGPHHVRDGALWRRDQRIAGPFFSREDDDYEGVVGLASFDAMSLSPSGRWALLLGNTSWGDYLHSRWLLLDTQSGELFSVSEPAWPAPMSHEALDRLGRETLVHGDAIVAENDVVPEATQVWLSDDRLVIDRWLIIPGEAVVELPGELAR